MAIDFPDTPTENDEFTVGAKTWIFKNSRWELLAIENSLTVGDVIALTIALGG